MEGPGRKGASLNLRDSATGAAEEQLFVGMGHLESRDPKGWLVRRLSELLLHIEIH
jgi:hypothetical protein